MQQAVFFKLCVLLELPASNFRKYSLSRLEATRKDDWWCASFFSSKPFWQIRQKPFYGKLFSYEVASSYQDTYTYDLIVPTSYLLLFSSERGDKTCSMSGVFD